MPNVNNPLCSETSIDVEVQNGLLNEHLFICII